MRDNVAIKIESVELVKVQAEVVDLAQVRHEQQKKRVDGTDYEAFLAQYGKGVPFDFA
jgi:hypothetical protein